MGECPGCKQEVIGSAVAELDVTGMTVDTATNTTSVGVKIIGLDLRHNCVRAATR